MVEQPVENVIPEPHSLKYLLCHILLLLLMKLNNLLHFVELVGKLGLLVNGGRSDILPAPVIESDESGDDSEEEGVHVI
jgi:hypothetical protein